MSPDLSTRAARLRELMDDAGADAGMLARTYERFALINAVVSRWRAVYRRDIRPLARERPIRVLDVGAGGGDVSRAIAAWARRDRVAVHVTALDADERAIRWARGRGGDVAYVCAHTSDLVRRGEAFDVVISNHLLHHLEADELPRLLSDSVRLLRPGGRALHRDIERTRFAYAAFAVGTLPFSGNLLAGSFIRPDGLTSIRRAYTAAELRAAAPDGWRLRRGFPARLELRWDDAGEKRHPEGGEARDA